MKTPTERIAGWLDVAAAHSWHADECKVQIHPVCIKNCTCHAISLDGRWVCSGDGSLTVFRTMDAATHFLDLAHVDAYELGEAAELSAGLSVRTQCVSFRPRSGLGACNQRCELTTSMLS